MGLIKRLDRSREYAISASNNSDGRDLADVPGPVEGVVTQPAFGAATPRPLFPLGRLSSGYDFAPDGRPLPSHRSRAISVVSGRGLRRKPAPKSRRRWP